MKQRKRTSCYLCGSPDGLTSEHIPPLGIFREPRPTNLITVPCCRKCNNGHSDEDDFFRFVVSAAINKNSEARALWNEKVVPNTLAKGRQRKKVRELIMGAKPVLLRTRRGDLVVPFLQVPQDYIVPSLVRITKALLWTFHPEVDYGSLQFKITQMDQYKVQEAVNQLGPFGIHEQRGNGAFHCWRGVLQDGTRYGMFWLLVFFASCAFLVEHPTEQMVTLQRTTAK